MNFIKSITTPPVYYKPKIWSAKTELLLKESQQKHQGILLFLNCFSNFCFKLHIVLEMLETRRKELEEELVRVEERANARVERVRERGNQKPQVGERDEELEELEAEIELYSMALGEDKDEDMELNPAEAVQGPLAFPKTELDVSMESG